MRKVCFALLLIPFLINAQDDAPTLVFQNVVLTPKVDKIAEFESALAAHNKRFHATDAHGCRVYNINSGPDIGKYIWTLGPTQWAALDSRPGEGAHDDDWANVMKHCEPAAHGSYWSFDASLSHFPADFNLSKLRVMYVDLKRNSGEEVAYLLGKIRATYAEHLTDEPYGIYWNQTSSTREGRDMAVIWFFDKWAWMGEDSEFEKKFEMVHGEGSWDRWLDDWIDATEGTELEFWVFRPDLSGLGGQVVAAARQ
ncbi:MAG: hypothetical protein R3301_13300 [Saprospiraceae bacterium]|nr:hypothetical protein [Saprospiraceae bacterium]